MAIEDYVQARRLKRSSDQAIASMVWRTMMAMPAMPTCHADTAQAHCTHAKGRSQDPHSRTRSDTALQRWLPPTRR